MENLGNHNILLIVIIIIIIIHTKKKKNRAYCRGLWRLCTMILNLTDDHVTYDHADVFLPEFEHAFVISFLLADGRHVTTISVSARDNVGTVCVIHCVRYCKNKTSFLYSGSRVTFFKNCQNHPSNIGMLDCVHDGVMVRPMCRSARKSVRICQFVFMQAFIHMTIIYFLI